MNLTRYEQESIINYNEEEGTAGVYTHNKALICKLGKLAQERPAECKLEKTSHDGQAVDYIIPRAWVRITPTRVLSEAQRETLEKARFARNSSGRTEDSGPNMTAEGSYIPQTIKDEKEV